MGNAEQFLQGGKTGGYLKLKFRLFKMKKIKLDTAKIRLNKEKVASLTQEDAAAIKGGYETQWCYSVFCYPETANCNTSGCVTNGCPVASNNCCDHI